jgi:nitrogen-specific signal transduction histidine kinase
VPADVAPRIFDPFFTTKASGTGLGLSIAQQIVSENGARLELSSRANPTVFAVVCPVRDGD